MPKLRVLQVLPDLNSGGVERGTLDIASYLVKHKHVAYVCSSGGILVNELEELGATHLKLDIHSKNPLRMLRNVYRLYKLIKKYDINIVHARSRAPAWVAFFATKLAGCAFVTTFHAAYTCSHPLIRFYNSVMLRSDKIIAISNFIKKHIETRYQFKSNDVVVINRGADLDYFDSNAVSQERINKALKFLNLKLSKNSTEKIILLPSRYSRLKGHLYLLHALKYLKAKNFKCIFVGKVSENKYSYYQEILDYISEHNLQDEVKVFGESFQDMPALYSICDVTLSIREEPEAFGRTVVEAQAMDKIVIATNIGGPREIIHNKKTGFLVPTHDPSTLADTIDLVLSMKPEQYKKITTAAKNVVEEKYSIKEMCKNTIKVYLELLEEREKIYG